MTRRRLRAVPRAEAAERALVREAAEKWKKAIIECRANGNHQWDGWTAAHRRGFYDVSQRCRRRCGAERHTVLDEAGYQLEKWKPRYTDPSYLMHGHGRMTAAGKAELRLIMLAMHSVIEVEDETA